MKKIGSAVLLVAAVIGGVFLWNGRDGASPDRSVAGAPAPTTDGGPSTLDVQTAAAPTVQQNPVVDEPSVDVSTVAATNVLRVVLEGITVEDARMTRVAVTGLLDQRDENDQRDKWPGSIFDSWPWQGLTNAGLTSEFDLDPFFVSVAEHPEDLHVDELEIEVDHPQHLSTRARVPLSGGVELSSGQTVYEVRVRLVPPVYWPELTLAVRDAHTRAHLDDVELSSVSAGYMGRPRQPGRGEAFISFGGGLSSPIVLLGGREADDPEHTVAGIAVWPSQPKVPGEAPELFELWSEGRARPGQAVMVYARAPGYAWGSIAIDFSTDAEREMLLVPAASLDVRMANVQLERYAELELAFTIGVNWVRADGGNQPVHFERLDESLGTEGLRLDALEPGEYSISVSYKNSFDKQALFLAREELSLAAGETRELVLVLDDPPAPPVRATLGGVVSFPAFGGPNFDAAKKVQLQFYKADSYKFVGARARYQIRTDAELTLADLQSVGGALPTWSFRLEDLPVGLYQIHLKPFLKSWMIELPAGGREDVELVIPELAEVLVEIVDGLTGVRIPIDELYYNYGEVHPGQAHKDRVRAETEEPGRFRFWTAPGVVSFWPYNIPSELDYGTRWEDLEVVPGLQSVRFKLWRVYDIRFEFRDGDAAIARGDGIWNEVYSGLTKNIRAVDHDGEVTSTGKFGIKRIVDVSAPGVYEVSFEGVGANRFHPIPPQRVVVRPGETAEVTVELRRK